MSLAVSLYPQTLELCSFDKRMKIRFRSRVRLPNISLGSVSIFLLLSFMHAGLEAQASILDSRD